MTDNKVRYLLFIYVINYFPTVKNIAVVSALNATTKITDQKFAKTFFYTELAETL